MRTSLVFFHSGINPILVNSFLHNLLKANPNQADLFMPMSPDMSNAWSVLSNNMLQCDKFLGSDFGNSFQRNLKSRLTIEWIRGLPIGQIIKRRLDYLNRAKSNVRVPTEIRNLIKLINDNSRYLIPKYLACYADCVSFWYQKIGRNDLVSEIEDMQDILEVGVAEMTMLALVGLGLSRTSSVAIASKIPDSQMSVQQVVEWLKTRNLEALDLSPVIIREATRALDAAEFH